MVALFLRDHRARRMRVGTQRPPHPFATTSFLGTLYATMNIDEAADRRIMILRARSLRRNATEAEKLMWAALRNRRLGGLRFRRQVVIGRYVVDFCCARPRLVIELDGSQHEERKSYDDARSRDLEDEGYAVLRFWNSEVLGNLRGVLDAIGDEVRQRGGLLRE